METRTRPSERDDYRRIPLHLVFFLLQDQDYVSRLDAGCLVRLPGERDLLPVLHSFVHVHL